MYVNLSVVSLARGRSPLSRFRRRHEPRWWMILVVCLHSQALSMQRIDAGSQSRGLQGVGVQAAFDCELELAVRVVDLVDPFSSGGELLGFTPVRDDPGIRPPNGALWYVRAGGRMGTGMTGAHVGFDSRRLERLATVMNESGCSGLSLYGSMSTVSSDFEMLRKLKDLRYLDISNLGHGPRTGDGALRSIAELRTIEILDMRRASSGNMLDGARAMEKGQVSDDGVGRLASLERLRFLNLSFCRQVTGECFARFGPHGLEWLEMEHSGLSAEGLAAISRLPKLRVLRISGTTASLCGIDWSHAFQALEVLDLSRTKVTDECLVRMAAHGRIRDLNLRGCAMTSAAGVSALARMKSLRRVQLGQAGSQALDEDPVVLGYDEKILDALRRELPACRLEWHQGRSR